MEEYDALDVKAGSQELLASQDGRFKKIHSKLSNFCLIEEINLSNVVGINIFVKEIGILLFSCFI
jgi:hypothetical protein